MGDCAALPSHHRSESRDPYDLLGGHNEVLMSGAYTEPGAPGNVFVLGVPRSTVMDSHVQHVHPACILAVIPSHVCQRSVRFYDDCDAMQL